MIRYTRRGKGMTLIDILEKQFFLQRTQISDEKTRVHYRRAIRWLGEMLGRESLIDDLCDEHLAGVMQWLQMTRQISPVTINVTHKCISAFWRWCRDRGLTKYGPTVRPMKSPRRRPKSMTEDELRLLVEASQRQPGIVGGMPAPTFWLLLFAIEIDTGMRAGELRALRWEWVDWHRGGIDVPAEARKGRSEDAWYPLADATMRLLASLRKPAGLLLGWKMHVSRYYQLWDTLLDDAGLPRGRRNKTHALRRTFATLVAKSGGDASAALHHTDPTIAKRCYVDPESTAERYADRIPAQFQPLAIAAGLRVVAETA